MKPYRIGIDIGSTSAKTVVLSEDGIACKFVQPTGWSSIKTAEEIRSQLEDKGFSPDKEICVATGYGRISVPYAGRTVTEITCHARGASWLYGEPDLVIIDIGGQDTKLIRTEAGQPRDFLMNDKCSAGTGRFLEIMGGSLGLGPAEICELAREGSNTHISSLCTVFAESEIVSLIGKGEPRENIAFAILDSITEKVAAQAGRFANAQEAFCLTGGLCECPNLVTSLSEKLKRPLQACPDARYAGAVGAALSVRP